jgi:hypothetical protein
MYEVVGMIACGVLSGGQEMRWEVLRSNNAQAQAKARMILPERIQAFKV